MESSRHNPCAVARPLSTIDVSALGEQTTTEEVARDGGVACHPPNHPRPQPILRTPRTLHLTDAPVRRRRLCPTLACDATSRVRQRLQPLRRDRATTGGTRANGHVNQLPIAFVL